MQITTVERMEIVKRSETRRETEEVDLGVGIVYKIVHQKRLWRVEFEGKFWSAKPNGDFELYPGDFVRIVGRRNISLLIKPV